MKSNYDLVREFVINRIRDYDKAKVEFNNQNIKMPKFMEGAAYAYEMVLDLMDMLDPRYDGVKEALKALDLLEKEFE